MRLSTLHKLLEADVEACGRLDPAVSRKEVQPAEVSAGEEVRGVTCREPKIVRRSSSSVLTIPPEAGRDPRCLELIQLRDPSAAHFEGDRPMVNPSSSMCRAHP